MFVERSEKWKDNSEQVNPSVSSLHLRQILVYSQAQSKVLFDSLPKVKQSELQGNFSGKLYAIKGSDVLPVFFRKLLVTLLHTPLAMWAGKCFSRERGANLWFSSRLKICFGHFVIEVNPETGDVEGLNYKVAENLPVLRPIYGEVRKFGNGKYFARMLYRTENQDHCLLYFTLLAN